uniref:Hydroxysteroid (11-beta) dehydrogenase 1-like a n=1 Tax=Maylandia zebra TaxID=106582 RepID=A0A3P9B656_9CICH
LGAQKAFYIAADMANEADPDKVVDYALENPFSMWKGMWITPNETMLIHECFFVKVNFFSYIQMAWKALPSLEQNKGSLVVVSSLLGKITSPFVAPYSSTKFALNGFFGSLRHELAMKKSNVSISVCTLGLIDTDSAMEKVRGVTDVPAYPATDAALNIIITGSTRQPELFYPWFTYFIVITKDWFPSLTDYMTQNSYNYIP